MSPAVPVLIVTGPVGVGKTTVANAISELLDQAGVVHAGVDLDQLRWCYPAPADDSFHVALGLRNLAAAWASYRAVGAERLILVDVVESRAELAGYQTAVPNAEIVVVRLQATLPTIERRLIGRELGSGLGWHVRRAAELSAIMERERVEDLLLDTDGRSADAVAREILRRVGWLATSTLEELGPG